MQISRKYVQREHFYIRSIFYFFFPDTLNRHICFERVINLWCDNTLVITPSVSGLH